MKLKVLLCCAFLPILSFAQEQEKQTPDSFSLDEAVAYAEQHAYEVANSNYDLQKAKQKIWETIASGLPQVSTSANYTDNLKLQSSLLPAEIMGGKPGEYVPVQFGQQYTANGTLTVSQLIFDGTYLVGLKASKVYYSLSENQMEKVRESIRGAVKQSYFYVLSAEQNYETLKENLNTSKKTYEEAKAYYEEGLREDTDADQAQLALKNVERQLSEAKSSIKASRTTLKYVMGVDVNKSIVLKSSLDDLVASSLLENHTVNLDWKNHIDYRILNTQHKAQELMIKSEKSAYLPRLSAFWNYTKNASSNEANVFGDNVRWFNSSAIGLSFSMPIFSSGMRHSRVVQQKLELKKIDNQMHQKLQEIEQNRVLALNDLETAKANYLTSQESLDLAKKIYEKTQLKYTEGVSSSFELTQNEQQYLNAHRNYIGALIQLLNANVAYEKALGTL